MELGFASFSLNHWVSGTGNHKIGHLGLHCAEKWDLDKLWAGKRDFPPSGPTSSVNRIRGTRQKSESNPI